MDEAGIRFLIEIYKDSLINSDEVQRTKKANEDPLKSVKRYLDRLDEISRLARENSSAAYATLLQMYYDKYVIKESDIMDKDIPDGETKESIINAQKERLKLWIDYLTDPTTSYPMWAKFWVFQGMLKMGVYDTTTNEYGRRAKKTVANFAKHDPALIAESIDTITNLLNGEKVTPQVIKRLAKTQSFSKIYTALEQKKKKEILDFSSVEDGIWVMYHQGNKEEAEKLSLSVRRYDTRWCTAGLSTAISQVCGPYGDEAPLGGDFYVYYTKNQDGDYVVPRIALRCRGHDRIGEIRGVADGQNIELGMEKIIEKKLREMPFMDEKDVKSALKKIENLKVLTTVEYKVKKNIELTEDEVILLYLEHFGFGWSNDHRVNDIIKKREQKLKEEIKEIEKMNHDLILYSPNGLPRKGKVIDNDLFILKALHDGNIYMAEHASERLWSNKTFAIYALKYKGSNLSLATKFQDDEEVVMTAIKHDPHCLALGFASERLKKDPKVIEFAILENDNNLIYVSTNLPNYRDIMIKLVRKHPRALEKLSTLQDDEEVVKNAYAANKWVLCYASKRIILKYIKEDWHNIECIGRNIEERDIMIAALYQCGEAIVYASKNLRNDREIMSIAVSKYGHAIRLASRDFINDNPDIVYKAIKNDPSSLTFLDAEFRKAHPDIEVFAVTKDLYQIRDCSEEFMLNNSGLVCRALREDKIRFNEVPLSILRANKDLIIEVLSKATSYGAQSIFRHIPEELYSNDIELLKKMVLTNPSILGDVSKELLMKIPKTIEEALKDYEPLYNVIENIPVEILIERPNIVLSMLLKNRTLIKYVPYKFQMLYPEIIAYVIWNEPWILDEDEEQMKSSEKPKSYFFDREYVIKLAKEYEGKFSNDASWGPDFLPYSISEKIYDKNKKKLHRKNQNKLNRSIVFRIFKERLLTDIAQGINLDGMLDFGKSTSIKR